MPTQDAAYARAIGLAWECLIGGSTDFRRAISGPDFDNLSGRDRLGIWTKVLRTAIEQNDRLLAAIDATREEKAA
jgi:hypothetical protein